MAAPETTIALLDLVRKSGLVEAARLDEYLATSSDFPESPNEAARALVRDGLVTLFQAGQLLSGKWRGFVLGKYRVLELLGTGGMGRVFLCEHVLMNRLVAVKVLPTAQASDPQAVERFYREARAAAALDHPNIVRAYDVERDDKLHYIVMEFVDGRSLHHFVAAQGPLPIATACHYIAQAAAGLQHAHEAGWVHRDVKPGNILVDRSGVVKVLDMGLARFFREDRDGITRRYDDRAVLGTADYLSPEQVSDSHDVDIRADVYSLGATLYFLLAGKAPFEEGNVGQKLLWHQVRDPEPLPLRRAEVPEELDAVVAKMMAKAPEQRYQTPAEVIETLAPWTGSPIPPPPADQMPRLSPFVRNLLQAAPPRTQGPESTLRAPASPTTNSPTSRLAPRPAQAPALPWWRQPVAWAAGGVFVLLLLVGWVVFGGRQPVPPPAKKDVDPPVKQPLPAGPVSPDVAAQHINETLTVEMTVENVGVSKAGKTFFLNSQADFNSPTNFTVVAHGPALLGGGDVDAIRARYEGSRIRVTGTVTRYNGRPQIVLNDDSKFTLLPKGP